jgi:hypothetical protein
MSGRKHTPGPWFLRLSDNGTPLIEFGPVWAKGSLSYRICAMPAEIMQPLNSYANARLIAAAPDLLDALERLLEFVEAHTATGEVIPSHTVEHVRSRAAIAKAKGGAA